MEKNKNNTITIARSESMGWGYPDLETFPKKELNETLDDIKKINLYNWGWSEIRTDILYLLGFLALFSILSILLLKREVK